MGKKYTREVTIGQIEEAAKDMSTLYRAPCVNHSGTTYKSNGNEYYTEIVSEYLLWNYSLLNQIAKIKRGNYRIDTHTGTTPRATSNHLEERIALSLFQKDLRPIGKIIDYQIPLNSKRKDAAGKIDLMAFDEATGILRLIELKAPESKETLLRCVLEIYTYYKTADINSLIDNFGLTGKCKEVRICPLFFRDSTQNKEYKILSEHRNLVDLMKKISNDTVKVELLRLPFENVKFVSSLPQSISNVQGAVCCNASYSKEKKQVPNSCTPGSGIRIPVAEQPNEFPLALEEILDNKMLEVEILDY